MAMTSRVKNLRGELGEAAQLSFWSVVFWRVGIDLWWQICMRILSVEGSERTNVSVGVLKIL